MPSQAISFGGQHFSKKSDAAKYLKDMLYRYAVGDKVSAEDEIVLRGAIGLHPEAIAKIGCGISHLSVRSADFGTRCFWINRIDGSTEKFSFRSCIYG
jgi:hypothetical protein